MFWQMRDTQTRRPAGLRHAVQLVMLGMALATASPALAEVRWHPDLPTARAAATVSNKPVLAIFTATWSAEAARLTSHTLASPEVEAVVTACFEPVLLDVDAHPAITKRMRVERVPAALVLGARGGRLASFECPEAPSAFVAAAARAAQAAATLATQETATDMPDEMPASSAIASDRDAAPPVGGSISLVTSKIEQLSDFAATSAAAATDAPPTTPTPPAAEAERASRFQVRSQFQPPADPASRTSIEPAQASPTPPTPWLSAAPQAVAAQPAAPSPTPQQQYPQTPYQAQPQPSLQLAVPPPTAALPPPAGGTGTPPASAIVSDLPEKPATTSAWDSFTAAFQKPFGMFSKPATTTVEPPTMAPAKPSSAALLTASAVPQPAPAAPDAYGSMPLGLEGYCPVTLAERGVWSEGRAQWGARHRGRTYLFAGPEQQQAFLANPDRFAPALSGDDPVLAIDQGKSLPGRRAYGVTYQSRMYLFATAENRASFTADPERYTNRVTLAERPASPDATRRY